jgi:integrase
MPKDWNGCLVRKGKRVDAIYFKYKKNGQWVQKVARTPGGAPAYFWSGGEEEVANAQRALDNLCRRLKERRTFEAEGGLVTVRSFAASWLKGRSASSRDDDEQHLRDHVFPAIGEMPIGDVRPKHLIRLIEDLRKKRATRPGPLGSDGKSGRIETDEPLAPRTVRNVYATVRAMFRRALIEEVVDSSPCVLERADLPAAKDKDPEWRDGAVFSLGEVATLIYDERIPQDRRVCYALYFLGCARFGEMAALRWRHYDADVEPLGLLRIARSWSTRLHIEKDTKAERPRKVPVTPQLAALLAEWKLSGWPAMFDRKPEPDDLIVPSRGQGERLPSNRSSSHMLKKFHQDCQRVGIRERRQHDSRRTWLSVVLAAGANETHAKWIAHGPPPTVLGAYMSMPWSTLCAVVEGLRLPTTNGRVVQLAR